MSTIDHTKPVRFSSRTMQQAAMMLAETIANARSKDPRTKVGACVLHLPTGDVWLGYNGFPAGLPDREDQWNNRDITDPASKYHRVLHAEENAIRRAWRALNRVGLSDCMLAITHYPCRYCMQHFILPSRIGTVEYQTEYPPDALTDILAREGNVTLRHTRATGA